MIRAIDMYSDSFVWGFKEYYHSVLIHKKKFKLFDKIRIFTKHHEIIVGEIEFIEYCALDISSYNHPTETIWFSEISDAEHL